MSINMKKHRDDYQKVSTKIFTNQFNKQLVTLIRQSKKSAEQTRQKITQQQLYQYLEEINFYIEQYRQQEIIMQKQRDKLITSAAFIKQSKQLFQKLPSAGSVAQGNGQMDYSRVGLNNSPLYNQNQSISKNVSASRLALNNFFDKKIVQVQPNVNFRGILQKPSVSPKNFKKKAQQDHFQPKTLISQNQILRSKIQQLSLISVQNQQLQTIYRQNQQQIQSLEKQNARLLSDNSYLRSKTNSFSQNKKFSDFNTQEEDYLYSPYTLNVLKNDIYKINIKNYQETKSNMAEEVQLDNFGSISDISQQIPVEIPKKKIVYKKVGYQYQNYTQKDYRQEQANINYSIFDPNQTYYSQKNMNSSNFIPKQGIQHYQMSLRNKIAFFKQKSLILRNSHIQIGVKRSLPQKSDNVRVILYFNNKSQDYKTIKIQYKYQQDHYQVTVTQKIKELGSLRQGREVIEVRLRHGLTDFNSIIDIVVTVNNNVYNLWLPAMFINLGLQATYLNQTVNKKDIYPSKSFSNPYQAKKVIDSLKIINNNQAQFWCSSYLGGGLVSLTWKPQKSKLKIKCDEKWLHFFAFLIDEHS